MAKINIKSTRVLLRERGLEPGGKVQQEVAKRVLACSEPYVPKDTGKLIASGKVDGKGRIIWPLEYARYVYYGRVVSRRQMVYQGGPNRGGFWLERLRASGRLKLELREFTKLISK